MSPSLLQPCDTLFKTVTWDHEAECEARGRAHPALITMVRARRGAASRHTGSGGYEIISSIKCTSLLNSDPGKLQSRNECPGYRVWKTCH